MNILLWALQAVAAVLYGASGAMKLFRFDQISADVPSFGAFPRAVWRSLGVLELVCTVALIVPTALRWHTELTGFAAALLAVESLVFVRVHVRYREVAPIVLCVLLFFLTAFIAYGRLVLVG